jgi:tetratricopeptide (TPR) repeat protein
MDRITRHKIKHDKFVDDVGTAYSYAREHSRTLVWGVVGAVAVIVAATVLLVLQSRQEAKAQERLAEAIVILEAPLESQAPTATGPKYKTEQEKQTKAEPILQEVAAKYPRTDAADVAGLYLAGFSAERGDIAAARPRLEAFLREHSDHILAGAAKRGLYELRIAAGEGKQVIAELERDLADQNSVLPSDITLALLAQTYELTGNAAKAREAYQRIVNEFPDSPYTIDAQRKLFQG